MRTVFLLVRQIRADCLLQGLDYLEKPVSFEPPCHKKVLLCGLGLLHHTGLTPDGRQSKLCSSEELRAPGGKGLRWHSRPKPCAQDLGELLLYENGWTEGQLHRSVVTRKYVHWVRWCLLCVCVSLERGPTTPVRFGRWHSRAEWLE